MQTKPENRSLEKRMTKLAKNDKLCTSQLFVVTILPTYSILQSPTLIPGKKILLADIILLCTDKICQYHYLINIMLTGKEFFSAATHLKLWHTA